MVDFIATYSVPYTPGELKAVGYTGGVCDGEFTLRTAQDAQMTLTADRKTLQANGEDAAFVMIQFVDANGTADLHTKHTLKVELEGAGILEAVGSANPCSEERYDTPESETYDGCCMAVIRAGEAAGEIHLTVTADDSVQKQLTILIQKAEAESQKAGEGSKQKQGVSPNRTHPEKSTCDSNMYNRAFPVAEFP